MSLKVGIQLYSLRDSMQISVEETLKSVKKAGYDGVEFAGFFGKTPNQLKAMLDEIGLECYSVHLGYESFLEEVDYYLSFFKALKNKYVAIPGLDLSKKLSFHVKNFNKASQILKAENIELLFHNHWAEFTYQNDEMILETLLNGSKGYVNSELDIAWARFAGINVEQYITKNLMGRLPLLHVKDFKSDMHFKDGNDKFENPNIPSHAEANFLQCVLGQGVVDVPNIIEAAKNAGCKILIVERDESLDMPSIESAKLGREYLKSIGY